MSSTTMNAFLAAVSMDEEMANGLDAAIGGKEGDAACDAVAEYATSKGYAMSPEEAESGRRSILDSLEREADLSDEQLDSVAGGQSLLGVVDVGDLASTVAAGTVVSPVAVVGFAVGLVNADLGMKIYSGAIDPVKDFFSKW